MEFADDLFRLRAVEPGLTSGVVNDPDHHDTFDVLAGLDARPAD
jgi:hypothetical protein